MSEQLTLIKLNSANESKARHAYEQIYNQYYKLVYFVAAQYLQNDQDIEDIVIETFVTLYEERSNVKHIKYFLTTIAKNKAINLAKKNSKVDVCEDSYFENISFTSNQKYTDVMSKVYQCLSKEDADIVIKHLVEGYPLKELAKEKKTSINTIKSKYRRSIDKLSKFIGDKYE